MKADFLKLIKYLSLVLLGLVLFTQDSFGSDKEELLKTIKIFNSAFQKADVETLDSMLTANYVHTNSGSRAFGKSAWLKWIESRAPRVKNGTLVYHEYQTLDLAVTLYKNTAIVTGRNIATGKDRAKDFKVDIRFTHVWIKKSGKWQRAAFHDAKAKG